MFEAMRIYIEKDGRPYNYLESLDDLNLQRDEHLKIEENTNDQTLREEEAKKEAEMVK